MATPISSDQETFIKQLIRERMHEIEPLIAEYFKLDRALKALDVAVDRPQRPAKPKAEVQRPKKAKRPQKARKAPQTPELGSPTWAQEILAYLQENPGSTTTMIAKGVKTTLWNTNRHLRELEDNGDVTRTGRTKGTRWHLVETPKPETITINMISSTKPTQAELKDREVAHSTEQPAIDPQIRKPA